MVRSLILVVERSEVTLRNPTPGWNTGAGAKPEHEYRTLTEKRRRVLSRFRMDPLPLQHQPADVLDAPVRSGPRQSAPDVIAP